MMNVLDLLTYILLTCSIEGQCSISYDEKNDTILYSICVPHSSPSSSYGDINIGILDMDNYENSEKIRVVAKNCIEV